MWPLIVGGMALGAGGSIAGALIGANASKEASAAMMDASMRAEQGLNYRFQQALGFLSPYQIYGLMAGSTLSRLFVSPQEQALQREQERANLSSQLEALKPYTVEWGQPGGMWQYTPILTGKRASERRETMGREQIQQSKQQYDQLAGQLAAFDKQTAILQQQGSQNASDILQESPAYKYASELTNRVLAAKGLLNSGEAIKQQGALAANLVGAQTQNLFGLYQTGAQAAGGLAQGAMNTGQQTAQAQMFGGQGQAQGYLGAGQAWQQGLSGLGAVGGALANYGASYGMNQNLLQGLAAMNKGTSAPQPAGGE